MQLAHPSTDSPIRDPWDGVLNVVKPAGWTSHDVVAKLRHLLQIKKIGHAGTLDPAATGVLPILLGKATRISEFLTNWDKEYEAVLVLGQETNTQDATGIIVKESSVEQLDEKVVRQVVAEFQGTIQQIPPMFSAVKVGGKPLYKAAREGREVVRQARQVRIHHIEVHSIQGPHVHMKVVCSKGTYIRTLCADIGQKLGVGGHLLRLERTRVGPFTIDHANSLEDFNKGLDPRTTSAFLSIDQALQDLPFVSVRVEDREKVLNGVPLPLSVFSQPEHDHKFELEQGVVVRVKDGNGQLLGLGQIQKDVKAHQLSPRLAVTKVLTNQVRLSASMSM